jgi:hypothetical protein
MEAEMKSLYFVVILLGLAFSPQGLRSEQLDELSKAYNYVSVYYSMPDNDHLYFADVHFRFGWTAKKPYRIGVQFVNRDYGDKKIKFAIKDVTTNKMILLDPIHKSYFGAEMLKANSISSVWSGPINNVNDEFSLHVWNDEGDELDKAPISIKNKK